jgi:hypothetical protein
MVLVSSSFRTDKPKFESIVRLVHGRLPSTINYSNIQNGGNRQWTRYCDKIESIADLYLM